jgi:membrane-bound lytic murein transglycosylase D
VRIVLNILFVFLILFFTWNCNSNSIKKDAASITPKDSDLPENLWVSESVNGILDSTASLYQIARFKLAEGDTLGAEIYFNQAFEALTQLSDDERESLADWPSYDSLFQEMNRRYDEIYTVSNLPMEAEEIREDIIEIEEMNFPDSVLFGKGTVVDTSYGFPITINDKVRLAIHYFQTRGRFVFSKWLERMGRYENIMREILRKRDVPDELLYLAMIESGLNPNAQSYARAVGMWQFISRTGKSYGLRNDWWFDERRDVFKSTDAAARHLRDLYNRFGDWYLALSGYNCNPKKVENNMKKFKTRDFWELKKLPRQTRNYTPTFLAATIIASNPKKFGFYVEKEPPLEVDSVLVSESVDLNVVARLVDTSFAYIKEINPAVLKWVTPPGIRNFALYLPQGSRDKFKAGYSVLPEDQKRSYVRHRVRDGEALSSIAKKYHTTPEIVRSHNQLKGNSIRAGRDLLIPVPQNLQQYFAQRTETPEEKPARRTRTVENVRGSKKTIYLVKPGDTLGGIAESMNVRASDIRSWNSLDYGRHIYPNQQLAIWTAEEMTEIGKKAVNQISQQEGSSYYTVKTGDTLWDISKKYGIPIQELKKINNMRTSQIRPGDKLRVAKN